jgi:hypothetical protein
MFKFAQLCSILLKVAKKSAKSWSLCNLQVVWILQNCDIIERCNVNNHCVKLKVVQLCTKLFKAAQSSQKSGMSWDLCNLQIVWTLQNCNIIQQCDANNHSKMFKVVQGCSNMFKVIQKVGDAIRFMESSGCLDSPKL